MKKAILLAMLLVLCVTTAACSSKTPAQDEAAVTAENKADDEMRALFAELLKEKGEIYTWSQEDRADFAQKASDIGYSRVRVPGTPGDKDMKSEDAIKMAKELIEKVYGDSRETLDAYTFDATLSVFNPNRPEWEVHAQPPKDQKSLSGYLCVIESRTGQIMDLVSEAEANG